MPCRANELQSPRALRNPSQVKGLDIKRFWTLGADVVLVGSAQVAPSFINSQLRSQLAAHFPFLRVECMSARFSEPRMMKIHSWLSERLRTLSQLHSLNKMCIVIGAAGLMDSHLVLFVDDV